MDYFVNLIMGESATLDAYVIIRILVLFLILHFMISMFNVFGGFRK